MNLSVLAYGTYSQNDYTREGLNCEINCFGNFAPSFQSYGFYLFFNFALLQDLLASQKLKKEPVTPEPVSNNTSSRLSTRNKKTPIIESSSDSEDDEPISRTKYFKARDKEREIRRKKGIVSLFRFTLEILYNVLEMLHQSPNLRGPKF